MLYDLSVIPPNDSGTADWEWLVPETQATLRAKDWATMVDVSRKHYAANGFSYGPALEMRIQQVICDRLRARGIRGFCYDDIPIAEFLAPLI